MEAKSKYKNWMSKSNFNDMYAHVLATSKTCNLTAASAFKMCDTSKGGIVSGHELKNCLAKTGMPACEQKGLRALA